MTDDPKIIPFGKYKGRLLDEVLLDDPGYMQWLSGQDWFRAKFNILHQVIINRGAEPEETPEHNAMQVRFLDDDFCLAVARRVVPDLDQQALKRLDDNRKENFNITEAKLAYVKSRRQPDRDDLEAMKVLPLLLEMLASPIVPVFKIMNREFESELVDVRFTVFAYSVAHLGDAPSGWNRWYTLSPRGNISGYSWNTLAWSTSVTVEIKPLIGDDYPAVLRQMRRNRSQVLLVGDYRGQGATRDQFVKTMQSSDIRVVFMGEV